MGSALRKNYKTDLIKHVMIKSIRLLAKLPMMYVEMNIALVLRYAAEPFSDCGEYHFDSKHGRFLLCRSVAWKIQGTIKL